MAQKLDQNDRTKTFTVVYSCHSKLNAKDNFSACGQSFAMKTPHTNFSVKSNNFDVGKSMQNLIELNVSQPIHKTWNV